MSSQRMSNADAAWLHMDRPTNLMVVNAVLWFEEPVDVERVTEILRARLVEPFPRFRQLVTEPRLGIGAPSWEDDPNFDLDRHVHHLAVPAPRDKRALEELVSDLIVSRWIAASRCGICTSLTGSAPGWRCSHGPITASPMGSRSRSLSSPVRRFVSGFSERPPSCWRAC